MPLLRRSSVQYMLLYIHTQQVILWFPCIRLCHISVQVFYKDQSLCTVCYQPNWKHPIIFCRLVQVQQQTGSFWIVIKSQRNSPLSISFLKTANSHATQCTLTNIKLNEFYLTQFTCSYFNNQC